MNIYEDEPLEQRLEELSDQLGILVLDLLLAALRKTGRETLVFRDFTEARAQAEHPETAKR